MEPIEGSHSGEIIYQKLVAIIRDFNISDKIFR